MKTLKVMSVVGIVLFALFFLGMCGWNYDTADTAIGYGVVATAYGMALSIVALVQAKRQLKR